MRIKLSFLSVAITLFLLACGGSPKQESHTGAVELIAQTENALTAGDVTRVTLTVSAADIATPIVNNLTKTGAHWTGVVGGIPTGTDRALHADAFDASNNVVYRGDASHVTVATDGTVVVALLLQQASPPTPFANAVPLIDSFTASSNAIAPSHTIAVNVTAHDPDAGDSLTYAWSATGGTFSSSSTASSVWTAPATEGAQTLTIQVTDPHGAVAAMSLTVSILNANGSGTASVTVDLNTWPIVSDVVPSPTRVNTGDSTVVTLTASDPDGDTLGYAWTAACAGAFDSTTAANPTFTIAAPIAASSCALKVVVTDGRGGVNFGTVTLQTGAGAPIQIAPQVDNTFQSSPVARPGDVLTFRVRAHDPQNGALTFAWSTNGGTLGTATNSAGESDITWTAPAACQSAPYSLTATITDAAGLSTVQSFTVTQDLATDPNNCGTCGTSCNGFACSAGTCNVTLGFKLLGTGVTSVLAGNTQVWGSDAPTRGAVGNIYQFNGTKFVGRSANSFFLALGGDGDIWALGTSDTSTKSVFRWNGNTFAPQGTDQLTEITKGIDDSNVWGLNGNAVFHYTSNGLTPVSGALVHIAAGGHETWGLDSKGQALHWDGTTFVATGATFKVDPNALIVTQQGVAWGIDTAGKASYWNGTTFVSTGAAMQRVSGGNDGTTWGLNAGVAYSWSGTAFTQMGTAPLGALTDISVGRGIDILVACDASNKRAFYWTQCVAPKSWSGNAEVCCSTAWSSPNTCA